MNSYDIWIHIFRNLCNHSCPWLTILSAFDEALTLWLQKTLKEGWLKIIHSPQELLCTPAPSDDALMSSIDKSSNKESSTAMLILFGPRLSCLCRWSEGTAASPHLSPSLRRRGKIPPIVVILCSNNDALSRPPPPSSHVVHRPPPTWGPEAQEPVSTRNATNRVLEILDAKYDKANLPAIVRDNCSHLTPLQQEKLLSLLLDFESLFDGTLGDWNQPPVSIELLGA